MEANKTIVAFIEAKKLVVRETETHFQTNCFICGETRERLGIDKKLGQWRCFNCDSNGTKISTLAYAFKHKSNITTKDKIEKTEQEEKCRIKKDMHLPMHKRIFNTKKYKSAKYLINERKISKEAIKHFQLGVRRVFINKKRENYDAGEHLAIPYIKDGSCVNIKYRSLDPEVDKKWKWRREDGGITAMFNDSAIDNLDYDHIYIAESEIDCISLWELGFKNVIGLPAGAKGFKVAWYDRLKRFKKIYLVLDRDKTGQEGAQELAKRLGLGRCYNVTLSDDVKDPNDFLLKYKKDDFDKLVDNAVRYEIQKVKNLGQIIGEMLHDIRNGVTEDSGECFDTPWPKINKILGRPKRGFLWVLAGKPKSGKTTLALNLMKWWGQRKRKKKPMKSGIYTCEMRDRRLGEKLAMMEIPCLDKIERATANELMLANFRLPTDKIFTFYPTEQEELEVDAVVEKTEEMVQRYGLDVMIIDNLHFLCRGDNENELVSQATQKFKLMAERLDILVVLITHPRKTNNNKQLKTDDLKGSSSIFQDADLLWLMHRPMLDGDVMPDEAASGSTEGSMSKRADILITGRWTDGGKSFLAFLGRRSLFKDRGTLYRNLAKELGKGKKKKRRGL